MSGFAIVTPYFGLWLVPKDRWPTQKPAIVFTIIYFAAVLFTRRNPSGLGTRASRRARYAASIIFVVALILGATSRLYLIEAWNPPRIDVPAITLAAVNVMRQMKNPYNARFTELSCTALSTIRGQCRYGTVPVTEIFNYLPFTLLYYLPFVSFGLDIRYGNAVADILTAVGIFLIALKMQRPVRGAFLSSLWSLSSLSIITTYYGNNHMVTTALLTLTVLALVYRRYAIAGLFVGLASLTTQFGILALPFVLKYAFDVKKLKSVGITTAVVMISILAPFVVTAKNFLTNILLFYTGTPISQVLGIYFSSPEIFGVKATTIAGILLYIILFVHACLPKNIADTDLGLLCSRIILATLVLAVLMAPFFVEVYLLPAAAMMLIYPLIQSNRASNGPDSI